MLTGQDLIEFVNEHEGTPDGELAAMAGFTRITKKGKEQTLLRKFYAELLKAKGCNVASGRNPGKSAKFTTTVHRSGVILLGKIYAEQFGVAAGDEFDIVIEPGKFIQLVPTGETRELKAKPGTAATKGTAVPKATTSVVDEEVEELVAA